MIVCSKCGAENPDATRFCVRCGAFLDWSGVRQDERAGSAVSASLRIQDFTVEPGGQAVCEVEVHNDGRLVDEYRLQVSGPDLSWCSVEPVSLRLMPKTSGTARVLFRPPRAPNPPAGAMPFVISVTSTVDPAVKSEVAGSVTINTFGDVVATLVPQTSESVRDAAHDVKLENRGNTPNRIELTAQDADDRLVIDVSPSDLTLGAGSKGGASLVVRVRNQKEPRDGRRVPFQVMVRPATGAPVRLDGATVLLQPQPEWWWKWRLAIAAALALVLITAVVAWAGPPYPHWPPLPQPSASPSPTSSASLAPAVANLTINPPSLSFGTVPVGGGSATIAVTVANNGAGKTAVTATLSDTKNFSLQDRCSGSPLGPNEQCQLEIAFTPQSEGDMGATVTRTVDNATTPSPIALSGRGQGHAVLTCVPPSLSFDLFTSGVSLASPVATSSQKLTCTNSGTGDLSISSVVLQDSTGNFSILSTDCSGKTLKPSTGCTAQVQFRTSTVGVTFTASILINDSLGQQIVPVQGYRGHLKVCILGQLCPTPK